MKRAIFWRVEISENLNVIWSEKGCSEMFVLPVTMTEAGTRIAHFFGVNSVIFMANWTFDQFTRYRY